MARGYGQYCPLALATELLGQRWTILIVSRLIGGCDTFNAIHKGVPRISPSLLSRRLTELESVGLLEKHPGTNRSGPTYVLTRAGEDLAPVIEQMAVWGKQWARDMTLDDLDLEFLAWSMHTRLDVALMPSGRTVIEFDFTGTPTEFRRFWIVVEKGQLDTGRAEAGAGAERRAAGKRGKGDGLKVAAGEGTIEMCLKDPGFEPNVFVRSELLRFVEAWRGLRDFASEVRRGRIRIEGPKNLKQGFAKWLLPDSLEQVARRRRGKELRVSSDRARSGN